MSEAIAALASTTFAGRRFTRRELAQIQRTVNDCRGLSLRELGHTVCEHRNWVTPHGRHRIQTCLNALEEMQCAGLFRLPEKRTRLGEGRRRKPIVWHQDTAEQPVIRGELGQFAAIAVEPVTNKDEKLRFNEYIDRYHYLGYRSPIGNHLRYFIVGRGTEGDRLLGCLLFAFAVNKLDCRDRWIGWTVQQREKHLRLVINNTRFLIFPWIRVKNLASKALSLAAHRVAPDWLAHFGLYPVLMETFVDTEHFAGTCYKAANWPCIGHTAGRKGSEKGVEKSPKAVFVHPLHGEYRQVLTQHRVWLKPGKRRVAQVGRKDTAAVVPALTEDDPFVTLWQGVIALLSSVAEEFDARWRQRRRTIDTLLLMLFIFRLVFSKNHQGYGTTIVELWAQCERMGVALPQSKVVSASAFCNARKKLDAEIFKTLNARIIEADERSRVTDTWLNRRVFAVDGTKINLPRPLLHADYALSSKNAHYPQGLVSCLYQLKSKIPHDFELTAHMDERRMALAHLKTVTSGDIVVYDRGYFSYAMLHAHDEKGVDAVFRLARRSGKAIDTFIDSDHTDVIVNIEVTPERQPEVREKHPGIRFRPLPLRLIKYRVEGATYILGTTLLDGKAYNQAVFPDLYHARWGLEELYKISKQLVDVGDFHAHTERGIKQELFAHFVLLTMTRMLANHTEAGLNAGSQRPPQAPRFQVNIKNALMTMARHLEELFLQQTRLTVRTLTTLIGAIGFCRQKTRPGRKYPRASMKPIGKWRASST
jgi:hypothetical protein